MTPRTIGIVSPGEMGQAVGAVLRRHGLRVVAALDGRSARTRALASAASIEDLGTAERLVAEADIILSILVPAQAEAAAGRVAAALRATGARPPLYADCNAVAPATTARIGAVIGAAGARFVDAGIIGPPPRVPGRTRFYASGEHVAELAALRDYGLDVRVLGPRVGQASGFKMCYGALTKGLCALATGALVAAERLDLGEPLLAELGESQAALREFIERALPNVAPKAHRWAGEMEEIAATLAAVDQPPGMLLGAAEVFRRVAATPLGHETPEGHPPRRAAETAAALSAQLDAAAGETA